MPDLPHPGAHRGVQLRDQTTLLRVPQPVPHHRRLSGPAQPLRAGPLLRAAQRGETSKAALYISDQEIIFFPAHILQ